MAWVAVRRWCTRLVKDGFILTSSLSYREIAGDAGLKGQRTDLNERNDRQRNESTNRQTDERTEGQTDLNHCLC